MSEEYTEPTNEQLANFLVIYAEMIPGMQNLNLSPPILESLLSQNPQFREGALRHHRRFQGKADELHEKMIAGKLQCSQSLKSGKRCPNNNEPGSYYCGLHETSSSYED